jgi:hypothetical protein
MVTLITSIPLVLLPFVSWPAQATCTMEPVGATAVEAPILGEFNERVSAYMQIHESIERTVSPRNTYEDPEALDEALSAMQSGIRAKRRDARVGDIFTADVSLVIRRRLDERLAACGLTVEDVLSFINEERHKHVPRPSLNKPFPWALGSAMPAPLIPALPPLPDHLQYRFADRDLVLIDIHADLVVDILANALPAPRRVLPETHRR